MSNIHEPTIEEINVELARSRLEMEARMQALQEQLQAAQERKDAEEAAARKAEEAWQKAEAEEKAERKAKAKREAEEAREKAKAKEKAKGEKKAREEREVTEKNEEEAASKAERVCLANRKRLDRELSSLERARQINAENAKIREEGFKPRAGSSKAMPMPTPKPKAPVNLLRQVWNEEAIRKTGKRGKSGDVAVSVSFRSLFGFSDLSLSRMSCATCA
jgi:hypothetical protein